MRYSQFKNKYLHLPLIITRDILRFRKNDKQAMLNQLRRWQDKGLIIKLKKGLYILNANDRKINPSRHFIANQLYTPSYVSLEYALNFYGLIPERVNEVTSITTKKTTRFINERGGFSYQHIKPETFRGFKALRDENGLEFFIAEPEKALVDFLYLHLDKFKTSDPDIFELSYRFQNVETLNRRRIVELARLFQNHKLQKIAKLFCEFIREETRP
jgi:predicted transcriptional regulator of viral defense system